MTQEVVFEPSPDGTSCSVYFSEGQRGLLFQAANHLRGLLTGVDETGDTSVLFPPAYGDDWGRQVEFDRLTKTDLSDSHVASLDILLSLLEASTATADEVEAFARAVNQIRLVFAKPLKLTDETTVEDFPEDHPQHDTWLMYLYLGNLQHEALEALQEMLEDQLSLGDDDPSNN